MKELENGLRGHGPLMLAILLLFLGAALIVGTRGSLKATSSLNLVYLETNEGSVPDMNAVVGFSNSGGTLTQLSGSPWSTRGTGVYDPGQAKGKNEFDADGQLFISYRNNVLYAVNGDSNTFAAFSIDADTGALAPLPGSPYKSEGSDPVSFGYFSDILSSDKESWLGIVNKGADPNQTDTPPNVVAFEVDSQGIPVFVTKSVVTLKSGTSPSQLVTAVGSVTKHEYYAFLDQYETSGSSLAGVYASEVLGDGGLKLVNSARNPTDPPTLGLALNPSSRVLYAGFPTLNEVGAFSYSGTTGTVSFLSAFANPGNGVGWLVVGPPNIGKGAAFLYTSEPGSGTITVYSIGFDGTNLTEVQHFTLSGTGTIPGNLAFDPTGAYLYCLDNVHAMLHVLDVDNQNGQLSEPNPPTAISEPSGEEPLGLATALY